MRPIGSPWHGRHPHSGPAFRHLRDLFGVGSVVGLGDGLLLSRYADSKDEAAFEALVSRHGPMVLTICRAVLRNEHDVEDAFQATFLVLARKARSIRGTDALGGWLHRVAYRASVQASVEAVRRRRKEAEASAMALISSSPPDPELEALLHEEIDRLPEAQRLPVVLCDLEGLSYDQAARQLRWTVPTLRNRLARGRQRLKARLTRRGLMAPAIGAILASNASAAVPLSMARRALSAATGGPASLGAALLTHTLLKGMLMTKIKIASTAALAALAIASAGLFAAGASERSDDPKPAMKPTARTEVAIKAAPAAQKSTEPIEVRGIVVGPDGKPVAGRDRAGAGQCGDRPVPEATSGTDGRFSILLGSSARSDGMGPSGRRLPLARRLGPGVRGRLDRACPAGRPAGRAGGGAGRGRPADRGPGRRPRRPGRRRRQGRGRKPDLVRRRMVDLAGWIAKARDQQIQRLVAGAGSVGLPTPIERQDRAPTAGSTGRDRPRDRVADLIHLRTDHRHDPGPRHEPRRAGDPRHTSPRADVSSPTPFVFHAPKFQLALAPTKPIEGVARDKDTGKPIAGLKIQARRLRQPGCSCSGTQGVEARTDDQGRYRLDGLPRASTYRLFDLPPESRACPITDATFKVPRPTRRAWSPSRSTSPSSEGSWCAARSPTRPRAGRCRVTSTPTPSADNPHVAEFPGSRENQPAIQAYLDADGRYQIVALPGPKHHRVPIGPRPVPRGGRRRGNRGVRPEIQELPDGPLPGQRCQLPYARGSRPRPQGRVCDLRPPGRPGPVG